MNHQWIASGNWYICSYCHEGAGSPKGNEPCQKSPVKVNKLEEFHRFLDDTPDESKSHPGQYTVRVYDGSARVDIQFHGWALVLLPDGKWFCLDTSGG